MSMEFKAPMGWHIAYGVSTILLLAASVIIVLRDYQPPWMAYQSEFRQIYYQKLKKDYDEVAAKDANSEAAQEMYTRMVRARRAPLEVKQLYLGSTQWLTEYKAMVERVDRCATCHMATDFAIQTSFKSAWEVFAQEKQPYKAHPHPELMDKHDPEKMGCTMCHGGQGRAIKAVVEAHGQVRFWEQPLIDDWTVYNDMKMRGAADPLTPAEHIQAACAKCHVGTGPLAGAPVLSQARQIFNSPVIKGNPNCLTCHRIGTKGGAIAPELTDEGNQWRDAEGWIRAHFRNIYPEAMKKLGVRRVEDVWTAPPQERYVYFGKWVYEHFLNPALFMPGYYITQEDSHNNIDNPDVYVFSPDSSYLRRYTADDKFIESYTVPDNQKPKDWSKQDITLRRLQLASSADPRQLDTSQLFDLNLRVSTPRTVMPPFPFTDEEAKAMTVFVMSLTAEPLPPQYLVQPQVALVATSPAPSGAKQAPEKVAKGDPTAGQSVFNAKGCQACHALTAEKKVGPGLKGLAARRDKPWLAKWLKDPAAMLAAEPKLKEWTGQFGGVIMPTLGLQDQEIADLIAYLETVK